MSWKAWYFVLGILALISGVSALYCAAQISPWAVGVLLAAIWLKVFEGMQSFCWEEHMAERRRSREPQLGQGK